MFTKSELFIYLEEETVNRTTRDMMGQNIPYGQNRTNMDTHVGE